MTNGFFAIIIYRGSISEDLEGKSVKKTNLNILAWLPLICSLGLLVFLNLFYHDHWLDSDMAAEMIFSKELARTGHFFATPDWYYSTEFRFLYTHWIMGPLFHVFSSWKTIRIITNFVTYALMLFSYFFFMSPFKVKRELVAASGSLLLLPFSETMMTHMVMGNTYMFHVIIAFLFMGCFFRLTAAGKGKKRYVVGHYLLLAVICGVSGVRYLLALQCPLLLAGFLGLLGSPEMAAFRETCTADNWKSEIKNLGHAISLKYFLFALLGLVASVFGYGINIFYVCRHYVFQTYEATNFIAIYQGVFLERLQNCLGSLIMLFGYIPDKGMISLRGLISVIAFVLIALWGYCSVWVQKREKGQRGMLSLFYWTALFLNVFVFVFSTSTMVPRYFLTIYIFLLPLLCFYLEKEEHFLDRFVVTTILVLCMLFATGKVTISFITVDKNAEKRPVAEFLAQQNHTFGYATYWNANIMTELTDGKVEVANVGDAKSLEFFQWSSPKKYYAEHREGSVFLLLTQEEYEEAVDAPTVKAGKLIYEDGHYVVLNYQDGEKLFEAVKE